MKKSPRRPAFPREIRTLYDDDDLIAIDKPPGLPAVPIPNSTAVSALSVVAAALKPLRRRPFIVHRIDRFTSGILLFALTERSRDHLVRQFLAHTPMRQYLALVRGRLPDRQATLVHYLRRQGMVQKVTAEDRADAARAELRYTVERDLRSASLLRVTLITGLQNQIRVQFAAIGHPVIGDRKYCPAEAAETRIARVALHAAHLEVTHPRTKGVLAIDCAPPRDFETLMKSLMDNKR